MNFIRCAVVVTAILWLEHPSHLKADEPLQKTEMKELLLVDFHRGADLSGWRIQDDVVMGGRSQGIFQLNEAGHGRFTGHVSLENNGGFSSLQWNFDPIDIQGYQVATLRVKGDQKRYQFRVQSNRAERHSYVYSFQTTGEWQTVEIPLKEMKPQFRGRKLDLPNYSAKTICHIRFFISNKKAESFQLEIDQITLN